MNTKISNMAILIDADNTPISFIDEILSKAETFGQIGIKKIYGDWGSNHLKSWQSIILEKAIIPVHQFAYTKGKNATDISMVIDAMDLVLENVYDGFCLVSSDSDFTPLAARLRANKIKVFGFGKPETPEAFQKACDEFIFLRTPSQKNKPQVTPKPSTNNQQKTVSNTTTSTGKAQLIPQKVKDWVFKAIDANVDKNGWAKLSNIVTALRNEDLTFSPKKYGFSKYPTLLKEIPEIEVKRQGDNYICQRKKSSSQHTPKTEKSQNLPLEIKNFILENIEKLADENGLVKIGIIGKHLKSQYADFSYQTYGFSRLTELLIAIPEIKIKKEKDVIFCSLKNPSSKKTSQQIAELTTKPKLNPTQIQQEIMILFKNSSHKKGWVTLSDIQKHFKRIDPALKQAEVISFLEEANNIQSQEIPKYSECREKCYRKVPFLELIEQLRKGSGIYKSNGKIKTNALERYAYFHVHYGKYGFQSFSAFFNEVTEYYKRKKANEEQS